MRGIELSGGVGDWSQIVGRKGELEEEEEY